MPMSEQVSGTHGRVEDEAIKRQDLSDLRERGELRPDADDVAADTGTPAVWAPEGRFAPAAEDWQAIEQRAELARRLDRTTFPAGRAQLLATLTAKDAEQPLLDLVARLPAEATVGSMSELIRALGLPVEGRGD